MWDCRLQSDILSDALHGPPLHGSALFSNSKGSRSRLGSDQYTNHQHSVSDGVLSYSGSPPENFQAPRWKSSVQKFNFDEFPTSSVGGSRCKTSWSPCPTERQSNTGAPVACHSFGSPSSLSKSGQWESASKQSISFPNHNSSSRCSFMSKPVYPLVFRNPVSDCKAFGDADTSRSGRLALHEVPFPPSHWPDNSLNIEPKFYKTLAELQKVEVSPEPGSSSKREGFRWSSTSSFDLGFDGESYDIAEHMDLHSLRSPCCPVGDKICGVCGKLLWQRSPWGTHRIVRGGDMPTAGVLPCGHVFHAECLEQMTPKAQICDPSCPLCMKTTAAVEEIPPVSKALQTALQSVQRSREILVSDADEVTNSVEHRMRGNWPRAVPRWNGGGSLIKNRLKKHLTFKGKMVRDIFSTKAFSRTMFSSSSSGSVQRQTFIW